MSLNLITAEQMQRMTITTENSQCVVFETETTQVQVNYYSNGRALKTRVYMSSDDPSWDHPEYTIKGEDPIVDAAWKVYNKEELRIMRGDMVRFLTADGDFFRNADKVTHDSKGLHYSKTAGCSCPCSPGFILPTMLYFNGRRVESMWVTLKSSNVYAKGEAKRLAREAAEQEALDDMKGYN